MRCVLFNFVLTPFLCLLLTACGGGGGAGAGGGSGGGGPPADPRIARLDGYGAQSLRVLGGGQINDPAGMPITGGDAMPIDGVATFEGHASVRVERPGDPLALFGDAVVNVDFQTGLTNGTLSDFFGSTSSGPLANYTGTISLAGTDAQQDAAMTYEGNLSSGATSLVFSGSLTTTFLSDPIAGIVAADLEAVIAETGVAQTGSVIIVAEGAVVPP